MRKALFSAQGAIKIDVGEATEWVRGNENVLLDRFTPLVSEQGVVLDFGAVERIDAGGLAVLVSLYRTARDSGHIFAITDPTPRVGEILAVVGLDSVLLVGSGEAQAAFELSLERDAA